MFEKTAERFELDLGNFVSSACLGAEGIDWEPEQVERFRAWQALNPNRHPEFATSGECMAIRYGGTI